MSAPHPPRPRCTLRARPLARGSGRRPPQRSYRATAPPDVLPAGDDTRQQIRVRGPHLTGPARELHGATLRDRQLACVALHSAVGPWRVNAVRLPVLAVSEPRFLFAVAATQVCDPVNKPRIFQKFERLAVLHAALARAARSGVLVEVTQPVQLAHRTVSGPECRLESLLHLVRGSARVGPPLPDVSFMLFGSPDPIAPVLDARAAQSLLGVVVVLGWSHRDAMRELAARADEVFEGVALQGSSPAQSLVRSSGFLEQNHNNPTTAGSTRRPASHSSTARSASGTSGLIRPTSHSWFASPARGGARDRKGPKRGRNDLEEYVPAGRRATGPTIRR